MRRKSSLFILIVVVECAVLVLLFLQSGVRRHDSAPDLAMRAALVRELELTDLCLFTEARYTRNPALADRHAPFQDGPMSLEHFPSGSLVSPPQSLFTLP